MAFDISIHALLTESDVPRWRDVRTLTGFQSTLSSRRATKLQHEAGTIVIISIHALLTESDDSRCALVPAVFVISIHALLTESDAIQTRLTYLEEISIHALLTESDQGVLDAGDRRGYFNPRSPHGERQRPDCTERWNTQFQSTLSSRRATIEPYMFGDSEKFQSTLSSRRATRIPQNEPGWSWKFQSTLSSRRATPSTTAK